MDKSGILYTRKFFIGPDMFHPGGSLWLGKWYITSTIIHGIPSKPFKGSIDNLRIWNLYLDAVKIRKSFYLPLQENLDSQALTWSFDEGEGLVVNSIGMTERPILLPDVSTRRPTWEFSYADERPPDIDGRIIEVNDSLEEMAEETCREVIYDSKMISQFGKYFSKAQLLFFYKACLNIVTASKDRNTAYTTLTSFADGVQMRFNLTTSPVQHLCHEVSPKSQWIGPDCDLLCVFGKADTVNTSLCVCDFGYWGLDCGKECPGGLLSPCNNHGKCNIISGSCSCELNWRGKDDCSACSPGWTGSDCSIAVSISQSPVCSVFTGGHFSSFDGANFNFFGVGEAWMVQNPSFQAQIRQVPCESGMSRCINAIGFAYQDLWKVVVYAPITSNNQPIVIVNDKQATFKTRRLSLNGGAYFEYTSSTTFSLVSLKAGINIHIRAFVRRLSFNQRASKSLCKSTSSLCGNCDGNVDNDMKSISKFQLASSVHARDSLFTYNKDNYEEQRIPTGAEFGLKFRGVGLSSGLLHDVFTANYITMQLWFKPVTSRAGVIFTYSKYNSLTLIFDSTIKIRYGSTIWNSGLEAKSGRWNQVTIVYLRATGVLTLYHSTTKGIVNHKTTTIKTGFFTSQSTIALGQWIPGFAETAIDAPQRFIGYLDEIQIWNKEFTLLEVSNSWSRNIQHTAAHLIILWKLNEGQGRLIIDPVSKVNLYIPDVPNAPTWVYSSAYIDVLSIPNVIKFNNISEEKDAKLWCTKNIETSPAGMICKAIGVGTIEFYYRSCLRIISGFGFNVNVSDAVIAFADYCQSSLNLDTWPARQMCNYNIFQNARFASWTGKNCDIPCMFGYSSTLAKKQCICDKSFWGKQCNNLCPGGPYNICSGHGTCSAKTGACRCDYNWQGKFDCSACSPGYYGKDCSVAFSPSGPVGVGSISGDGHFVTLDGLKVKAKTGGEFYAYISSRLNTKVQIRLDRQGVYNRVRSAVVQISENTIAIHASYGGIGSILVTINGVLVKPKKERSFSSIGFVFRRVSQNLYVIAGPNHFKFQVYHRESYLDLALTMDKSACLDSCGLLGQCAPGKNNYCVQNGIRGIHGLSQLTQTIINNAFNTWVVPANESGFEEILKHAKELRIATAGSCLFFNDTSLITPSLKNIFTANIIGVQFYIKVNDSINQAGAVISFASQNTLALIVNDTVHINYGSRHYDTGLSLEVLQWNQVSLVYWKLTGLFQIYLISSKGSLMMRTISVGLGAFPSGCTLGIGIYQVTSFEYIIPGFVGWIDDLVIWNQRLDAIIVQQLWKMSLDPSSPGIAAVWNFNEGSGYEVKDLVSSYHISLPKPPWKTPEYEPSDLALNLETQPPNTIFFSKTLEKDAKDLCSNIMFSTSFTHQCANAVGNLDWFYRNCLTDIASLGYLKAAIGSTISMATLCEVTLNLTSLPGRQLCNLFTNNRYGDWVGRNCSKRCVYGIFNNEKCVCDSGYWNIDCSKECPGGATNPCSGHGTCDVESGRCICAWNWKGDELCKTCSEGWIGKRCSIAISKPPIIVPKTVVCTIVDDGFVSGFDGSLYSFSLVGEFLMITSSQIEVQIRQVPCHENAFCLNALALSYKDKKLSIHAPYSNDGEPTWHLNNKNIGKDIDSGILLEDMTIKKQSTTTYKVKIQGYLTITLIFNDRYLNIETEAVIDRCKQFGGLCGSCSRLISNNTTRGSHRRRREVKAVKTTVLGEIESGNNTDLTINEIIYNKLRVKDDGKERLIVLDKSQKETPTVYGGIYCLKFNFSAVISKKIKNLFSNDFVTIQLLSTSCKSDICGGVLLSYVSFETFYISNFRTVKVGMGNTTYDTHLETNADKWNMISVVVVHSIMKLYIYVTDYLGLVRYKTFTITTYPFVNGGTLAIGLWQPASGADSTTTANHVFNGAIDEVRIWERKFDYVVIKQSKSANIQKDADSLKGLWKFNKGEGSFVEDSLKTNHLNFPEYPLKTPTWSFSDAPIDLVLGKNPNRNNITLLNLAEQTCYAFILSGPVFDACKNMGNVTLEFYFRACTEAIITSGEASMSMDIIIAFSSTCQSTLNLLSWPAKLLCNEFPSKRFPNWIGRNCTTLCVFGKAASYDPDVCVCNQGYFGVNCSGICYGGSGNTCNKHGICNNKTGECECELNWRGNKNCTRCTIGWTGKDCSFAITEPLLNSQQTGIASISLRGHFTVFSGLSFATYLIGEYFVIYSRDATVQVQVRLVECYTMFSCVNAIGVRIGGHSVVIHGPKRSSDRVITWLDNEPIDIDANPPNTSLHGFTISRLSLDVYTFKCPTLTIKIRIHGKYLVAYLKAMREICQDSIGLLGDCSNNYIASLESYQPIFNCTKPPFNESSKALTNYSSSIFTMEGILVLLSKLQVNKCYSIFIYSYEGVTEYRESNSGYALYFDNTAAISSKTIDKALEHDEIVIDFMINIRHHGVILSYCKVQTFFVTSLGGKLSICFGNTTLDTNIKPETYAWSQIVLVYVKSTRLLQFYYVFSSGAVQRVDFNLKLTSDFLETGGHLVVGGWMPSLDNTGPQQAIFFVGSLDQLHIWNRYFHPTLIKQVWKRKVLVPTTTLKHIWRFNRGEGKAASDAVGTVDFELPTSPWKYPSWKFSDLKLYESFYQESPSYQYKNKTLEKYAEHFCYKNLMTGPLKDTCKNLGKGIIAFYYRKCLRTMAVTSNPREVIQVFIDISDYCQTVLNLTVWPAKPLCNDFPLNDFPTWFGSKCNKMCLNGIKIGTHSCLCRKGFWGSDCSKVCPGGATRPCSNHGVCDPASGKCSCQTNWKGSMTCSKCSIGWRGRDCSIPTTRFSSFSSISGSGHYGTFDGISFLIGRAGEFNLITNLEYRLSMNIRQVPCYLRSVCANAIATRICNTVIIIRVPTKTDSEAIIWINGSLIQLSSLKTLVGNESEQIHLSRVSRTQYYINWKNIFSASVRIQGRFLSARIYADSILCANASGVYNVAIIM